MTSTSLTQGRSTVAILRHPLLAWLAMGALLLVVYLLFPSQQYDPDTLVELKAINQLDVTSADPAHMLYARLGAGWYAMWRLFSQPQDALWPMQVLNALMASGAMMLFALVLRHYRVRWSLTLLVSLFVGFSYGFWTHTADAFFIIPSLFFALMALLAAVKLSTCIAWERRVLLSAVVGICFALSALTYQTNLALLPALLVASWPTEPNQWRSTLKSWVAAGVTTAVLAGGVWALQGIVYAGADSPAALLDWFFAGHGGMVTGLWRREGLNVATTVPLAWLATTLPVYEGMGLSALRSGELVARFVPGQLTLALLAGISAVTAVLLLLRLPRFWRNVPQRRALLTGLTWLVVPGAAVAWFDPAEVKLWLISLFGLWLMAAVVTNFVANSYRLGRVLVPLWAILVVGMGIGNFLNPIWPNHTSPSAEMAMAREATAQMTPERDLLISAAFDWTSYVLYLSDDYRVLNAITLAQYGGKESAAPRLQAEMAATWDAGGRVLMVDYFSPDSAETWTTWITPFTLLTPADFETYQREEAWSLNGETVWELSQP